MAIIIVNPDNNSGGTVTTFTSGNLSPLFTTSVAAPGTTPALSFAQVVQAANLVYAGPTTGAAANPTFRALVSADMPALVNIVTVAQMQALIAGASVRIGQWYFITGMHQVGVAVGQAAFLGITTSQISAHGFGGYQDVDSISVFGFIGYDVANDWIVSVQGVYSSTGATRNVYASQLIFDSLSYLPIADVGYNNSRFEDCDASAWGGAQTNKDMQRSSFKDVIFSGQLMVLPDCVANNCAITSNGIGGICDFANCTFMPNSVVTVGGSDGAGATFDDCIWGNGKTFDDSAVLGGYTQTGAVYQGTTNTFVATSAITTKVNPDAGDQIDFTDFAGFGIVIVSDATNDFNTATGFSTDHVTRVQPELGIQLLTNDRSVPVVGDNIQYMTAASVITIDGDEGDFIDYQVNPSQATIFQSIIQRIRV